MTVVALARDPVSQRAGDAGQRGKDYEEVAGGNLAEVLDHSRARRRGAPQACTASQGRGEPIDGHDRRRGAIIPIVQ
jgi:hypothetical protein